jgi:hypothetical protein
VSSSHSFAWPWAFALASVAAQETASSAPSELPCEAVRAASDYHHDGFFARVQAGLMLFSAHVEGSLGGRQRSQIRAYGQSSEISVGATVAPGAVVALSIMSALLDPTFVENGIEVSPDDDSVKVTLARVGPLLDWYPNPARGFHAQVAASLALQAESDEKGRLIEPGAAGVAFAVGLGQEWFVSQEISIGFVARVNGGHIARAEQGLRERSLWVAPELALAYTYH